MLYRKPKNPEDIKYILENLREQDRHEVLIQRGKNFVKDVTNDIMTRDDYCVVGCKKSDDTPVCMGGCVKTAEHGVGIVWFLSTPEITEYKHCFFENLKKEFLLFDKDYWMTFNIIFCENKSAKSWLKKFGYKFDKIMPNIPKNFEFFYRTRKTRGLNSGTSTRL